MEKPPAAGVEIPNGLTRPQLDVAEKQAVRIQFATDTSSAEIKTSLEFSVDGSTWQLLVPPTGKQVAANANQTSTWYAIPKYLFPGRFLVRGVVRGDGALSPRYRYLLVHLK